MIGASPPSAHSPAVDHSGHSGHGGHGGSGGSGAMCSMNMLFTWDTTDLCVVFKWWHVRSRTSLLVTLLAIAALSAGYEWVRYQVRLLDNAAASSVGVANGPVSRHMRANQALAYAFQVGYSYLLMLVFMTYNGWAMIAVCVGAGAGFWFWGDKAQRSMSCH